jgi:hypothetical protein
VADLGTDNKLYAFHKINGVWSGALFAQGSRGGKYDASRIFLPHIEIDAQNRGWISCKMGTKDYGTMYGEGLWLFENMSTAPVEKWFQFLQIHKGNGNVSIDPARPGECVMMAANGLWARINSDGQIVEQGQMPLGHSGEKIRFLIAPSLDGSPGIWHTAMGGWRAQSSSYVNSSMAASIVWAYHGRYRIQETDVVHPAVGIDLKNPYVCYISSVYEEGVVINVWNGQNMLWSDRDLPVLDPAGDTGINRLGPQWTPTGDGGSLICWTRGNSIMMRHVKSDGTIEPALNAEPIAVCIGSKASMCTDSLGDIHMVYDNGGIKYRKLIMQ